MIKLFCDCADFDQIVEATKNPLIKGFTTNPTLVAKAGVTNYIEFIDKTTSYLKEHRPDTCISFEVFSDDLNEMRDQAVQIVLKSNITTYVKIPVITTNNISTIDIVENLLNANIPVNLTAVFTSDQIASFFDIMRQYKTPSIISIFAGRLYDIGIDAVNSIIFETDSMKGYLHNVEVLWASPRQVYDYKLAQEAGCDIITMTPELIKKLSLLENKTIDEYCLDTVKMFYEDGKKTGFKI